MLVIYIKPHFEGLCKLHVQLQLSAELAAAPGPRRHVIDFQPSDHP